MIIEEKEILHFGKKGMRWGVRKKVSENKRALLGLGLVSSTSLGWHTINSLGDIPLKRSIAYATTSAAIGVGTGIAMNILKKNKEKKYSDIKIG